MAYLFFSVGLHNPHSHPRTLSGWVTIAKVALLFIVVSPTAGSHTLYYHSMAHGWLIPIISGHTFLCNHWMTMRACVMTRSPRCREWDHESLPWPSSQAGAASTSCLSSA